MAISRDLIVKFVLYAKLGCANMKKDVWYEIKSYE